MSSININGREVAKNILEKVKQQTAELKQSGWPAKLVTIKVGVDPAVDLYIRNQQRVAEKVGIVFEERDYSEDITIEELMAAVQAMNVDPQVTGIFIQRPIPSNLSIMQLQAAIHPLKDVEGMHPSSIGNIVYNQLQLGPCTAVASVELLKSTEIPLNGMEATVVGHSEIVGKPIAFLLMAEGVTVTVCHHLTRHVAVHSRRADAVFVAVGKANLITGEMLKPGAAVIDIGINQIDGPDGKPKVVGDCDYESCKEVAGWITPVPGGVGPVTVAILMRNAIHAAKMQKDHYSSEYSSQA